MCVFSGLLRRYFVHFVPEYSPHRGRQGIARLLLQQAYGTPGKSQARASAHLLIVAKALEALAERACSYRAEASENARVQRGLGQFVDWRSNKRHAKRLSGLKTRCVSFQLFVLCAFQT